MNMSSDELADLIYDKLLSKGVFYESDSSVDLQDSVYEYLMDEAYDIIQQVRHLVAQGGDDE